VIGWLLDGDPAIRWQVLSDLTDAPAGEVAAERARVAYDGWGARLLALEDPDGLWDGGACFPASYNGDEPGQPWTATMHTLQTLQILGLGPASHSARRAIGLVAENGRWEHAGQRFFDGEVEPCINGRTIETGAYFGVDVAAVVERILAERLADGGWNCEAENGSVRSSFDTTINVLDGLLEFERAAGGLKHTGPRIFAFQNVGESSGALRAGGYAMAAPERIDRLVFAAFTYKGEGSPTLKKRAEQVDYYRSHNMRKRDRDMIRSIATRDKPGTSDPAAVEALADVEMQFGDQIPTGTYLDMTANLPVVHPEKVLAPVLLVRGEYDGIATVPDIEEFFNKLPNGDRQFIILPGTAHSVTLATNRQLFWHVAKSFLNMPSPMAT